jgi:hypothetical protein
MEEKVSMPKSEFIEEHRNLVKTLRTANPKKLETEARKQNRELQPYRNGKRQSSGR